MSRKYLICGISYNAAPGNPLVWWSPLHGWDPDMDNATRYDTLEDAQKAPVSLREVSSIGIQEEPSIFCLIFDDPKNPDRWLLALNTGCDTAQKARTLLEDRIANGEAFSTERCAEISLEEYNDRQRNQWKDSAVALMQRQAE